MGCVTCAEAALSVFIVIGSFFARLRWLLTRIAYSARAWTRMLDGFVWVCVCGGEADGGCEREDGVLRTEGAI